MRVQRGTYLAGFLLLLSQSLLSQKVLYSPFVGDPSSLKFEVVAKAGDYYWLQIGRKKDSPRYPSNYGIRDNSQSFEIYDSRVKPVRTVPFNSVAVTSLKEYFISDERYFDRLILVTDYHKTNLYLQRYAPDGTLLSEGKIPSSFPFNEIANNFLLIRSEDKTKILILGFETGTNAIQKVHALLFNRDWNLLVYNKYEHPYLSQPMVQYDFTNYPIEHFSNAPVKVANSGDWLMTAPSRSNHNFLIFHFMSQDSEFVYKEVKLPASSSVESVSLSLDNRKNEVLTGVLARLRYPSIKSVSVAHYSLQRKEIDFDSSYRFSTLNSDKMKNENLFEEDFIPFPGAGFMLLKEYGRTFTGGYRSEESENETDPVIVNRTMGTAQKKLYNNEDYTRISELGSTDKTHKRGDLNLFYFPADKNETPWTGIISKEQITELNSSFLSYFIVPIGNKLFFLYNSRFKRSDQSGSTTILDQEGNLIEDAGIAFWDINNTLIFQKARQIASNEVVIPYERNQREGFAVIKF
ncbi:MAG: hypothetical protein C5B52_19160 [Bacteroidetes bacterium]|nr:MAG: hypothetical protein C5B52_19160 [Bacteroidota bacterium]